MEPGILERVLTRRYGQPVTRVVEGLTALCWNPEEPDYASTLYFPMRWNGRLGARFASLMAIYGDTLGGFLINDSLKVALLVPRYIFGVGRIDELQMRPAVRRALQIDPAIVFFMNASGVWYYGYKQGDLYVFDSEFDELDSLGPIEPALQTVLDEWEAAGAEQDIDGQ